ncbi:MAG TPA: ATP-binding cassette domain-containing protein, partial [Lautropia sp.]|nr:ATP-binding cassette domain-containing protein [Lautropia sp.]
SRILVLDEPTVVLTPQESESLFTTLRKFTDAGLALIFISHKLDEVLRVSRNIIVLKHGRAVLNTAAADTTKAALAQAMIGSLSQTAAPAREYAAAPTVEGPLIELQGVSVLRGEHDSLHDIGLQVKAGEVLAIAGVAGNGQQTLAGLLSGEVAPQWGRVRIGGRTLPASPRRWIDAGVARIPEDRIDMGVIGDASLADNAMVHRLRDPLALKSGWVSRRLGLLDRGRIRAEARRIVEAFDVRHSSLEQPIRMLSGGNIQKFILGRELGKAPTVVIASQPTWGLDIGAVAFVHGELLQARARGAAVLLISEDLEEIRALADRVAVIFAGRLSPARPVSAWDATSIGLAMAGGSAA